jgi:hypothetical protein
MFVHSAKSGELRGGRLTLRGVGHTVTWVSNGGQSGVVSVRLLHRRLFAPGTPPATGTLHVAGGRPGTESAFALTRPRYKASRQTVSYAVKRLGRAASASGMGSAAQNTGSTSEFGAASLSIVGAPPVLGSTFGGLDCQTNLTNHSPWNVQLVTFSNWSTDTWNPSPPSGAVLEGGLNQESSWESDGGLFRGCSASAVWEFVTNDPKNPAPTGTFEFNITRQWLGTATHSCTYTNTNYPCTGDGGSPDGVATWAIG